ncbi:uncharacterized protein BJ171DRAFT_157139 [Polychytrium aggregatum]|uniref:uncharacterized protein n=1 Tax=Polychytrium aggregatum TaxID=110093 RepID=UPI0022FDED2D|nr:uncharacterized protein BJ171DRAFT_157139 [Polychytrium aggregatum]KAI9202950.1 hypothetical protein BJ171DRAFT_157139 [Polychytrium aggregatum]
MLPEDSAARQRWPSCSRSDWRCGVAANGPGSEADRCASTPHAADVPTAYDAAGALPAEFHMNVHGCLHAPALSVGLGLARLGAALPGCRLCQRSHSGIQSALRPPSTPALPAARASNVRSCAGAAYFGEPATQRRIGTVERSSETVARSQEPAPGDYNPAAIHPRGCAEATRDLPPHKTPEPRAPRAGQAETGRTERAASEPGCLSRRKGPPAIRRELKSTEPLQRPQSRTEGEAGSDPGP